MTRRLLFSAGAALALVLAPVAANAYEAPGYDITVSDVSPTAGQPFTVALSGATPGATYTLTATSSGATVQLTSVVDADGNVSFRVTLTTPGTYTLAITNEDGALVADAIVTVEAASSGGGDNGGGELPDTGFDGQILALGAGALVLAGTGAVVVARRRSGSQV